MSGALTTGRAMSRRRPGKFRRTTLPAADIKLRCVECDELRAFERQSKGVYCAACGKRHSQESLVDTSVPGFEEG